MKYILLWVSVLLLGLSACHEPTVGFLVTKNAGYKPDTLYVRKTPDPVKDAVRIQYKAPWISSEMQGVEGTKPLSFSVESVSSEQGEEAVKIFQNELSIRGFGTLSYPLQNEAKPGTYKVSVRVTNEGYSNVVMDAMTIIVED